MYKDSSVFKYKTLIKCALYDLLGCMGSIICERWMDGILFNRPLNEADLLPAHGSYVGMIYAKQISKNHRIGRQPDGRRRNPI